MDHKDDSSYVYVFNEMVVPKNTDHTISYITHYLKGSRNVPSWILRVHLFLDNAESTNKNYLMSWAMELVEQWVMDYI